MAQAPQQQVQVLQPLSAQQVQHLYLPQQHMVYSGHLSGSTTLQNVGSVPGVSLQIQPKGPFDSRVQNVQPLQRTFLLQHHKQPHYSSVPVHSNVQILNGTNLSQVPHRQVISAQAPGHVYNSPQVLGSYALSPLPPGYSWASTSYSPQSPFIIRTPQPNIYVQHPQSHMAMHVPMSMHAASSAIATQNYPEICQETQTIATETHIPTASQSTPCSSISSVVSSNAVTTITSTQQPNLYSLPANHTQQYSQSFDLNHANQSGDTAAQNSMNQSIESVVHTSANQPVDSVTQTSAVQVIDLDTRSPIIQSVASVTHTKVNESLTLDQSNQYSETTNLDTAGQYIETSAYNQTHQSTESIICNQSEQYSESPKNSLSNKFTESQATQCSQVDSKQSLNMHIEDDMEVEQSIEVLNQGYALSLAHHMQEQPIHEPVSSSKVNHPSSSTMTSSPSSTNSIYTFKDQSTKPPLKTYSYTVVSPSSTTQNDNTDEGNDSGTGFYPIIKLKRLKPQDPLGKPDSVDKHPQKAIVKPQMLAPVPDMFQMTERPRSFPEPLKPAPGSPESLPLKKRKVYPIEENDDVPVISTKFPEPIPPISDNSEHGHKRGRGRPRKSSSFKTPVKRKSSASSKSPVISKTPSPKRTISPVTPKKEANEEQSSQETRRSKRRKTNIEVIEIVDDHDTVKMEIDSPLKSSGAGPLIKSSYSVYSGDSPKDRNVNKELATEASSNLSGNVKASGSKDNAFIDTSHNDCNSNDNVPSTSKESSFDLANYDLNAITAMSVQEVCDYVNGFTGCSDYGEVFKSQEIDGQALLLLNLDHLVTGFSMRLGPAVKLIAHINDLKVDE